MRRIEVKNLVVLTFALIAVSVAGAAEHMVGGSGINNNTIPFWGGRSDPGVRWQTIWLQSELGEAGAVTKIEWQNWADSTGSGGTFSSCKMYLCHTSLSTITTTFNDNYTGNTPVEVYNDTFVIPSLPPNTWHTICEPTNFDYDNTNNLLMEVTWVGPSVGGTTPFKTTSSGGAGRAYAWDPAATTATSSSSSYAYYGRITITPAGTGVAPTSLGRVKSIFK
jgi:hypothetical protein